MINKTIIKERPIAQTHKKATKSSDKSCTFKTPTPKTSPPTTTKTLQPKSPNHFNIKAKYPVTTTSPSVRQSEKGETYQILVVSRRKTSNLRRLIKRRATCFVTPFQMP